MLRLGSGLLADAATGALVAFEIDHVRHKARVAWSVLVRGRATLQEEAERLESACVAPTPLVLLPGDRVLAVRLDVVTGRQFRLDIAPSPSGRRESAGII